MLNLLSDQHMKKIEATIQRSKINMITEAMDNMVSGFTIIEGNGRGLGKRHSIRSERGTKMQTEEFNKVSIIQTIVDDSIVEKVSKIIEDLAYTGEKSDGIITVSNIESVLNISSKEKDAKAL